MPVYPQIQIGMKAAAAAPANEKAANKKQKKQGKGGGLMGRDCFVAESKYPLETPVDEREGVRGNNSPCTPPFGAVFA